MISGLSRAHARARVKLILREQMAKFSEAEIWTAVSLATKKLGYPHLRTEQKRVLKEFINGSDVFGASRLAVASRSAMVCCQPLRYSSGVGNSIAVVVSPLLALMKDQVYTVVRTQRSEGGLLRRSRLRNKGRYQPRSLPDSFCQPRESLEGYRMERHPSVTYLSKRIWICVAIDEAHCVKKWQVQDYFCVFVQQFTSHPLFFRGRHSGQSCQAWRVTELIPESVI